MTSVKIATNKMAMNPGIMPSTFMVAGIDMIPAPIVEFEMLKTAPENEAPCMDDDDDEEL